MITRGEAIRGGAAVAVVALTVAASCSSGGGAPGGGQATGNPSLGAIEGRGGEATGAVGLNLTIGNGVHLNQLSWTISNGTNSYSGTIYITDDAGHEAQSVEFVAGGILAGTGYVVTLAGADSAGDPCGGTSATFTVTAGATTNTFVVVTCTSPTDATILADVDNGVLAVNATATLQSQPPYQCPGIAGIGVNPAELMPPETSALAAQVVATADAGTLTLQWTSTCGTITNPTSPSATFSCGSTTGVCTVTLTVGLIGTGVDGGSVGQVCTGIANTTASENITCEAQCNTASDCNQSTACLIPSCVSNRCVYNNAAQGTACTDSGGSICNGGGTCVVPSFDVVRLGTGSAATAGQTAAVFVDNYSLSGTLNSSIALPTSAGPSGSNQALTLINNDVAEGDLTTSTNGQYVVIAGHNYPPGTTITSGNCIAGFINASGTPNTSMVLSTALGAGGSIQSAASNDGQEVWVAGNATDTTGGLWYEAAGMSNVQLVSLTTASRQARFLGLAGGQLYADTAGSAAGNGLFTIGTGEPTSGSPTPTLVPGLPSGATVSPFAFLFFKLNPAVTANVDTVYAADDRNGAGGIVKFTLGAADGGGSWTSPWGSSLIQLLGTGADGGTTKTGFRGLAGYVTGSNITLMATTGMPGAQADQLVVIHDTTTSTSPPTPTVVATSATNEVFRGVAVPPHN